MIEAIDHIGIAVRDLDGAIRLYRDILGFELQNIHALPEQKVTVAFFSAGQESRIELLEPLGEGSPIGKFLDTRGEGIHHIAIKVTKIEEVFEEYKRKDVILIDEKPRTGAEGKKVAFVHPRSTRGVLLEIVEESK